ncbi:hypothetical protein P171DRAFT_179085 [Karstenula rhodostoma CBS 690.94]|uniref:Uncharacterized protein n=1 Tax=Karstenula rhodostoma CBS 690.94 TaxID=1392251 RepID=A0A9P4P5B8_9PLEO|nr:hypothetical protein P171DRAFT_179085 [Karstenula rhodostoma CBS 690.94]
MSRSGWVGRLGLLSKRTSLISEVHIFFLGIFHYFAPRNQLRTPAKHPTLLRSSLPPDPEALSRSPGSSPPCEIVRVARGRPKRHASHRDTLLSTGVPSGKQSWPKLSSPMVLLVCRTPIRWYRIGFPVREVSQYFPSWTMGQGAIWDQALCGQSGHLTYRKVHIENWFL